MVGLNFSSEAEAEKFCKAVNSKVQEKQQRRMSRSCMSPVTPVQLTRGPKRVLYFVFLHACTYMCILHVS